MAGLSRQLWGWPTSWDAVCRRAGGRRRHNLHRRLLAERRRLEVAGAMAGGGLRRRGAQAELARRLGVSRSTVCRDVRALLRDGAAAHLRPPGPTPLDLLVARLAAETSATAEEFEEEEAWLSLRVADLLGEDGGRTREAE